MSLKSFFSDSLSQTDIKISQSISAESNRQQNQIEMIASENIVSKAVLEAQGSILTNKYAEGYPSRRYYGGCEYVDIAEQIAIDRVKKLFNCEYANVQSHSGAQANGAVLLALCNPGDTILGMSLDAGGHLTHGARPSLSGKWFNSIQYGVRKDNLHLDYDQVESLAKKHNPSLIIAGGSAIPRQIDFKRFRKIADSVGAILMVDMAHISGLVAGGAHPNPIQYADVVTSTTHKTLRGPRGGIILSNNSVISKKINSAVFPGLQGGPLMHVIAAKAVAFGEALNSEFKQYSKQVIKNAQVLSKSIMQHGFDLVTGGTDTHLLLVDLRSKKLKGNIAESALERSGITCNKNGIPFDNEKPTITSGIRLGTPAGTTRGFGIKEFSKIGEMIGTVLNSLINCPEGNTTTENNVRREVEKLCKNFPLYN